jgi:hypothetical protein
MSMKLSSILAATRQKLRDEFVTGTDLDWQDDELKIIISEYLRDVSLVSPNIVRELLVTTLSSKELNISSITDLMFIQRVEYTTGGNPRNFISFEKIDNDTIELKTSTTPAAGSSGVLAGTVTFNNASTAVTGSGTAFATALAAGDHIRKSTGSRWYRISSITSATALVLAEICRETTGADTVNVTQYCKEAVYLFCAKLHTLSDTTSTLSPQLENLLIIGTAGQAAINRAQELIDKVNTGGASTPSQLQAWGTTQIQLYRDGLRHINRSRQSESYPES